MAVEQNAGPVGAEQQLTRVCSGDTNDNRLVIVISLPCYCIAFPKKKANNNNNNKQPNSKLQAALFGPHTGKGNEPGKL